MNPQLLIPTVVTTLHNLFTAIWVGGMIVLALAVLPALRKTTTDGKLRLPIAMAVQKRLRILAIISMAGLALTGMILTKRSPAAGALFQFGTPYASSLAIKHILMILMILTAVLRSAVNQQLIKAPAPKIENRSTVLLLLNIIFGIGVLFFSALLAVLPAAIG